MTLNDLQNEVLSLTFESELESHDAFVNAANRALMEIHSERDKSKCLKIYKIRLEVKTRYERLHHECGEIIKIPIKAKAFSLTAVGIGKLLFTDGFYTEEIEFKGNTSVIKRFVNTGIAFLEFRGDFTYDIYELAGFDSLISDSQEDIPVYSDFELINMKERDPLFLAFLNSPKDSSGKIIKNLRTEGSLIYIPSDFDGEINVSYKLMPRKILKGDLDTELDVSPECYHLLALRCAAYLLLEENEGLAEYYLSLYKSGMSAVKVYNRKDTSAIYEDVIGWA